MSSWQSASIAIRFLHWLYSTEVTPRGETGFRRWEAPPLVFSGQHFQVLTDLLIERGIERPLREQRSHPPESRAQRHDEDSPSMRFIMATVLDQRSASIASCFLPARVIE